MSMSRRHSRTDWQVWHSIILCDYDGRQPGLLVRRVRWVLDVAVNAKPVWMRVDRTRNGWHLVVAVSKPLSPLRVVLVQALLGSDWRRETFNARRVSRLRHVAPWWRSRCNVLYDRHHRGVVV